MENDDLLSLLSDSSAGFRNGRCELIVENGTPAGSEVDIIQGGAKFFYRDGTNDMDGPRPINLHGGNQRTSFYSKKPSGCVYQIFVAIKVKAKSQKLLQAQSIM